MLENVRNLTAHDGGKTFRVIREHLEALGYNVRIRHQRKRFLKR